ncbi:MAG: ABC transporter substrate-binding protein [Pseudomonadota bacterium]
MTTLSAQSQAAAPGVGAKTIVIGQSAALSGPAKELGIAFRNGALAYFDHVNAAGGVGGRHIVLKTLDDGYESERAAKNTQTLIEKEGVFALFGYVGTQTSAAALPLVSKEGIPFFAPFSGARALREPFNENVFHVRASYAAETEKIIENLAAISVKQIAVFYQNDADGKAGLEGVLQALKKRGIEVVTTASVEHNSVDVTTAVAKIKRAKPQAIVMISAYSACAAFVRGIRKDNESNPYLSSISFVGSQSLSNELADGGRGVMISQVVPLPFDERIPVVKDYHKHYLTQPERETGFVSMEGYIAAKILVEGLRRSGAALTRESFAKAMESMSAFDAGGFVTRFGPNDHNGSEFIDLTVLGEGGRFSH